jgi:hypothetical protein
MEELPTVFIFAFGWNSERRAHTTIGFCVVESPRTQQVLMSAR